jgi:hypothetical protein
MSDDWKQKQAKLLEEIEAFARSKPDLSAFDTVEKRTPRSAEVPLARASAETPRTPAPVVQPAAPSQPSAPGGSLLEKLKREAEAKRLTDSQVLVNHGQRQRALSDALQAAFTYLREFCEQLNVLKPPYPLAYGLLNLVEMSGLTWQEGRTDYRLVPQAKDDKLFEQVTFRFRLSSGQKFRIERENPAHVAFRSALSDANIAFQEEEFRNARSHVERAVYIFPAEVKAGIGLSADYESGEIRMLVRNIRRFGAAEYRFPPDALTQDALEEIGRLVLGEESRIDKMFRRVA